MVARRMDVWPLKFCTRHFEASELANMLLTISKFLFLQARCKAVSPLKVSRANILTAGYSCTIQLMMSV